MVIVLSGSFLQMHIEAHMIATVVNLYLFLPFSLCFQLHKDFTLGLTLFIYFPLYFDLLINIEKNWFLIYDVTSVYFNLVNTCISLCFIFYLVSWRVEVLVARKSKGKWGRKRNCKQKRYRLIRMITMLLSSFYMVIFHAESECWQLARFAGSVTQY